MNLNQRIAVIGAGQLGTTLIEGLIKAGVNAGNIHATVASDRRIAQLRGLGINVGQDNPAAVADTDVVILAVKPQAAPIVCKELAGACEKQVFISAVAATGLERLRDWTDHQGPLGRAMPNTPCQVGEGMTVLCGDDAAVNAGFELFAALGRTLALDESHMNAVTALGASGVAFVYVVLEALAEGGVKTGLPRAVATEIAAQTMLGAARMVLDSGEHPALLKDAVTTPAGCTIDGLMALEAGGIRVTLINAIVEAAQRAGQLEPAD